MVTLTEAWLAEATIEGNASLSTGMYAFGGYQDSKGTGMLDLNPMNAINEIEKAGQHWKEYTVSNQPLENMQVRCLPVNGIPAKWSLGKVTNDGAGLHTIENFTTSRKPTISAFKGTDSRAVYGFGCVAGTTDWSYQLGTPIMVTQNFKGRTNGTTTDTPTSVSYPSDVTTYFRVLDFFKWNNIAYAIEGFRKQEVQTLTPFMGGKGFYQDINEFSAIEAVWTVIFSEGVDVSNIEADKFTLTSAGANTGTARDVDAKVLKAENNAQYIRFLNEDAICIDLREEDAVGQPTRYTGTFLGGKSLTYVKDGVADAFY